MNSIMEHAVIEDRRFEMQMASLGYKKLTTFYGDLTIAEQYGPDAVKETYNKVCKEWIGNYKYFTEFVMCLNHKAWAHCDEGNTELSRLYSDLYYDAEDLFYDYYDGNSPENEEARNYHFDITD